MPKPHSRESLQGLKDKLLEEKRNKSIDHIIERIYQLVYQHAETNNTVFKYECEIRLIHSHIQPDFYRINKEDILQKLNDVFPECNIKYTTLVKGQDGIMYDIENMELNIIATAFIKLTDKKEYIVIDWS